MDGKPPLPPVNYENRSSSVLQRSPPLLSESVNEPLVRVQLAQSQSNRRALWLALILVAVAVLLYHVVSFSLSWHHRYLKVRELALEISSDCQFVCALYQSFLSTVSGKHVAISI